MQPDPQLIQDCLRQDRSAQERLYKACFGTLMGICRRYHRDREEAISALNLGFFKILSNLSKYRPEVPFQAWISRIMINAIIDEFRRSQRYKQAHVAVDFTEQTAYHEEQPFQRGEYQLDAEEVEQLLHRLPPTTRQVFNLFAMDGYSHKDIGQLLGITEGTSKWHVAEARKQLTAWLQAYRPHLVPDKARTTNE